MSSTLAKLLLCPFRLLLISWIFEHILSGMSFLHCLTFEIPITHVGLGQIPSSLRIPSLVTVKYSYYISLSKQEWSLLLTSQRGRGVQRPWLSPWRVSEGRLVSPNSETKKPLRAGRSLHGIHLAQILRCPMGSVLKAPSVLSGCLLLFPTIFTSPMIGSLGTWKGLHHIDGDDHAAGTRVSPLLLEFYHVGALTSSSPGGREKQKEGSAGKEPSGWSLRGSPQPLWVSCSKAEGRPLSLLQFRGKAEKRSALPH